MSNPNADRSANLAARLVLRIFVEVSDADHATELLTGVIEPALERTARVRTHRIEQYWKIPAWYEVRVDLDPLGDPDAAYDRLFALSEAEWHSTDFEKNRDAVWNSREGSILLAPEVRWAHLELWFEQARSTMGG